MPRVIVAPAARLLVRNYTLGFTHRTFCHRPVRQAATALLRLLRPLTYLGCLILVMQQSALTLVLPQTPFISASAIHVATNRASGHLWSQCDVVLRSISRRRGNGSSMALVTV